MSAGHTPGPWVWNESLHYLRPANPDPARYNVHTILDIDQGGVGFIASDRAATSRELAADYALIAAAPLLYAALEAACRVLSDLQGCTQTGSRIRAAWFAGHEALGAAAPPPSESDHTPTREIGTSHE